jgi:Right handed beta helix region
MKENSLGIKGKFYSVLATLCCILLFFNPFVSLAQDCVPIGTPPENIITLPTNVTISSTYPQGVNFYNKFILVSGDVSFDRNVGMQGCTVIMGENAKISVQSGSWFATLGGTITGCTRMWNAIVVNSGAYVVHYGTTFRNGTNALYFQSGFLNANTQIVACTFTNNYIGIRIGKRTSARTYFSPPRFDGNTFTSTGGVLIAPLNTQRAYCGIYISNADVFIGDSGTNTYSNTLTGIRTLDLSDVSIKGETFFDMLSNNTDTISGNGIYSYSAALKVEDCTFTNNPRCGLFTIYPKTTTVRGCIFNYNKDYAIKATQTNFYAGQSFLYTDNDFNLTESSLSVAERGAIYHQRAFASAGTLSNNEISDNRITVSGLKSLNKPITLILVDAPNGGDNAFPIGRCTISVSSRIFQCDGIWIRGAAGGYNVNNNTLDYTNTQGYSGKSKTLGIVMEMVNGSGNQVKNNTVNSNFLPESVYGGEESRSNVKCGFHIDRSPNVLVCSNHSAECYRGYHFSGALGFCDFARNEVGSALYGIAAISQPNSGGTSMGQQDFHENEWTGTYDFWGALFVGILNPATDRFFVDVTPPLPGAPNRMPPSVSPLLGWFTPGEPTPAIPENSSCIGGEQPPTSGGFTGEETAIIKGTQGTTDAPNWDIARRLYRRLIENPDLRPLGSEAKAFYDAQTNSSFGRYAQAERQYQSVHLLPSAQETQVFGAATQVAVWRDSLAHLIQLEAVDTSSITPVLQAKIAAVLPLLETAQAQMDATAAQASLIVGNALLQTSVTVNALPSSSVHEGNLKIWLQIAIKSNTEPGLDATDYSALKSIAEQCPNLGGEVVTKAAWMLPYDDMAAYQDEAYWDYCDVKERESPKVDKVEEGLQLIPNPAMDKAYLHTPPGFGSGNWHLMDLNGRSLTQGVIATDYGTTVIDLSALPEGMYLIKAQSPSGRSLTIKLVHQH